MGKTTTKKGLKVKVLNINDRELEIELSGVETYFVNALRRILLAEVSTMAAETLRVIKNTSIVQDEVIAHRLGLVPLKVTDEVLEAGFGSMSLSATCSSDGITSVYSGDLKASRGISMPHTDILIAKLTKGQELELEVDCITGVGSDHGKFSPVCHASFKPSGKPQSFILDIETVGSMTSSEAFLKSLDIFERKLDLSRKLS